MGVATGAATGAGIGSFFGPVGTGVGAGIGALVGWAKGRGNKNKAKPGQPEDPYTAILQKYSEQAQQEGEDQSGTGSAAMAPALKYYRDLLSADPNAVMSATAPERGRVIDQYDTARKAVAQFGPRGGGTTGALAQSRFDQAESMGDITSEARRGAASGSAELGLQLQSLGLSHEALASQDIGTIIQSILNREYLNVNKRGQTMGMWGGIGTAAGSLLAAYLTRKK